MTDNDPYGAALAVGEARRRKRLGLSRPNKGVTRSMLIAAALTFGLVAVFFVAFAFIH